MDHQNVSQTAYAWQRRPIGIDVNGLYLFHSRGVTGRRNEPGVSGADRVERASRNRRCLGDHACDHPVEARTTDADAQGCSGEAGGPSLRVPRCGPRQFPSAIHRPAQAQMAGRLMVWPLESRMVEKSRTVHLNRVSIGAMHRLCWGSECCTCWKRILPCPHCCPARLVRARSSPCPLVGCSLPVGRDSGIEMASRAARSGYSPR
jgi:hypothetical protein